MTDFDFLGVMADVFGLDVGPGDPDSPRADVDPREFSRPTSRKRRGRPQGSLNARSRAIRDVVVELTTTYERMTVRGVFYQVLSRGLVGKDGYRPVQYQVLKMRREGVLDWSFIADGTRWQRLNPVYDSVEEALQETVRTYRHNLWRAQRARVEVWLEKDALADVVFPTTDRWRVPLMVSRGQTSDTYAYTAAQHALEAAGAGIRTHIFMLYDSDDYGRSAAHKVEEKVRTYSDVDIRCDLLAVTDEQVDKWSLPTRPDKKGRGVVELDAIPPDKLNTLVDDAIIGLIDPHAWDIEKKVEESERAILEQMVAS